jgi:hypothetical protein
MIDVLRAWRASFSRRWHANYDLAQTNDTVAGHQQRVAVLALLLEPNLSREALIYALTHDQGEARYGDTPYDVKRAMPDVATQLAALEEGERQDQGFPAANPSDRERRLIRLCDWLDAYLWMTKHAPHLAGRDDWIEQRDEIRQAADALGIGMPVWRITIQEAAE